MNKIYLIIPKIIEQPTWGGSYILKYKNWLNKAEFKNKRVGQSYELFSDSKLQLEINSSDDEKFTAEIGLARDLEKASYLGNLKKVISINEIIKQNPKAILGQTAIDKQGSKINILIKFTQAKGNSYQIHPKKEDETNKWKAKPESWYFFEPGLITLGLNTEKNIIEYKNQSLNCEEELKQISFDVKNKTKNIIEAKQNIEKILKKYNLNQFVNTLRVKKEELIDLSAGGIHHSWEESDDLPKGNIVYELCKNVMDPISTVRNFDKGKMKDNGELRQLQINEYFKFIDESPETNKPANHRIKPYYVIENDNIKVESLLKNDNYFLDKITILNSYKGEHSETNNSYNHIFVKSGSLNIKGKSNKIKLTQGHSCFVPASVKKYSLEPINGECVILKSYVG